MLISDTGLVLSRDCRQCCPESRETIRYDVVYSRSTVGRSGGAFGRPSTGVALALCVVQNPTFDLELDQA